MNTQVKPTQTVFKGALEKIKGYTATSDVAQVACRCSGLLF